MATNQEEKPAKPRTRNRKASDQRKEKAAAKRQTSPDQTRLDQASLDQASLDQARLEASPISPMTATIEETPVEIVPAEAVSEAAPADLAPEAAPPAVALEKVQEKLEEKLEAKKPQEAALSGEVLPPETRRPAALPSGLSGIAHAYGEYTRKSWANGRFLVERLIAARSLDEAIEIQGEFAKQAYTNFIVQAERICVLYGEWALGLFRPLEKFATRWPQVGR